MNKIVSLYQPDKHFSQLAEWYHAWGMGPGVLDLLPPTGLIIEDVCALLMYETNSKVCFLESFIVNPNIPKAERGQYFDQIGECMIHYAREKGYKYMMGNTRHQTVVDQLKKFEFQFPPHSYRFFIRSI